MLYDVFISHASEDKEIFVKSLAEELKNNHIEVWYDEFSLKIGDSLRRSIDIGLSKSRYGIVVLSNNFFSKEWPQWELDGLVQRQLSSKENLILPIWLNIEKKDIIEYSPSLADKVAIKTNGNVKNILKKLIETIKPNGSTLIIARDILIEHGMTPPVVTDDWWLDIIEYSGTNPMEGTFQESMGWGRWGFPLPEKGESSHSRGERLAWAAMQKDWQNIVQKENISQITHPHIVLNFIENQPGLKETCFEFPHYLATYAPQLMIKGFGGIFEKVFQKWFQLSINKQKERKLKKEIGGTGLTINKEVPECDEPVALRHPEFGFYNPSTIACFFVQGHLNGPPVKVYDTIDYIVWFLSSNSDWMPIKIKNYLITGLKEWNVWHWTKFNNWEFPFEENKYTGKLFDAMYKTQKGKKFKLTDSCLKDIQTRFAHSKELLDIKNSIEELTNKFIENEFIEFWIEDHNKRKRK